MQDLRIDKNPVPPKWFDGIILQISEVVENPFTGKSILLSPLEVAIYNLCRGVETVMNDCPDENIFYYNNLVVQCRSWFSINNPKAYMLLLD